MMNARQESIATAQMTVLQFDVCAMNWEHDWIHTMKLMQ